MTGPAKPSRKLSNLIGGRGETIHALSRDEQRAMPMLSPTSRKLLAVARALRYRTLAPAIGQKVKVVSEASAVDDVLEALDRFLPPCLPPKVRPAPGLPTVAKYALLDLEFPLPPGAGRDLPRLSRQELRDLDVLLRIDPDPHDGGDVCLPELLDDVSSGACVLKIILDASHDDRSVGQRLRHAEKGLPPGYLPRLFRVRDACITNAPHLWLQKHLYL